MRPLSFLTSLIVALACSRAPMPSTAEPAAIGDGLLLTREEVTAFVQLRTGSATDPFRLAEHTQDPAEREAAEKMIRDAVGALVWIQTMQPVVERLEIVLDPAVAEAIAATHEACVASACRNALALEAERLDDEQLRRSFEQVAEQFRTSERRALSYIFLATPPDMPVEEVERRRALLGRIREEILAGATSLREAAILHSEAPSASRGGALGNITAETPMNPALRQFIFSLRAGELSEVVQLHNGLYLAELTGVVPASSPDVDQVLASQEMRLRLLGLIVRPRLEDLVQQTITRHGESGDTPVRALARAAEAMGVDVGHCDLARDLETRFLLSRKAFDLLHADALKVDESAVQAYYDKYADSFRERGLFQLRILRVPVVSRQDSKVPSLSRALELLNGVRDRIAVEGIEWLESSELAEWVEAMDTEGWVQSTGIGLADEAILGTEPGGWTPVIRGTDSAWLFFVKDKRVPPIRPLAEVWNEIVASLTTDRRNALLEAAVAGAMEELRVVVHYPENPVAKAQAVP
jgi:hypothetical protein